VPNFIKLCEAILEIKHAGGWLGVVSLLCIHFMLSVQRAHKKLK